MAGPGTISATIRTRAIRTSAPISRTASQRPTFSFRRIRRRSAIAFYAADQFPAEYRGDAFVTLHGSWNRSKRTGYKVVRLLMKDGKPTGVYEDFLVGFVDDDKSVWGRPVGVAVAHDGSLLVSDDGAARSGGCRTGGSDAFLSPKARSPC